MEGKRIRNFVIGMPVIMTVSLQMSGMVSLAAPEEDGWDDEGFGKEETFEDNFGDFDDILESKFDEESYVESYYDEEIYTDSNVENELIYEDDEDILLSGAPYENGIYQGDDGNYYYYNKGVVDSAKNGFYTYDGYNFFLVNGKVDKNANGLVQDIVYSDDWYYCANGQAQNQYTGLVEYNGAWFYVNKGKLDTTLAAFVEYNGGLFYVGAGRIMKEVSGLAQDPKGADWYYLAEGQAQTQYTGLAQYDGAWFYVKNGKLASDYTGTAEYDGSTFYIENGMMVDKKQEPTPSPTTTEKSEPVYVAKVLGKGKCGSDTEWYVALRTNKRIALIVAGGIVKDFSVDDVNKYLVDVNGKQYPAGSICDDLDVMAIGIGKYAFGLNRFKTINISCVVEIIREGAFSNSLNITELTIPSNVKNVGVLAFYGCSSLQSVTIEEGLTYISAGMFGGCDVLQTVYIPKSVTDIYMKAFIECPNLQTIYYAGSQSEWNNITIHEENEELRRANVICLGQ